jgi:glutamyl-Q tRNA(Asp) synthetase
LPTPRYAHVPALVEADGRKLAKSARSVAVDTTAALPELIRVFDLLGLAPPASLRGARLRDAWAWAIAQWRVERVPKRLSLPVPVDRD